MLTTSDQDTREDGVSLRPWLGTVAAIGFAGDDRRADHSFRLVIRGVQGVDVEETQQMRPVFAQAPGKASVIGIGEATPFGDQGIEASFQATRPVAEGKGIQSWFLRLQLQSLLQKHGHLCGKLQSSSGLALLHLLQVSKQMSDTFLLEPIPQTPFVIGQKTIGDEDAWKLLTQNVDGHVTGAVGTDGVDGDLMISEDPKPGCQRANSPTGFVGVNHAALPNQVDQLLIHRAGGLGQLSICPAPAAAADLQTETVIQRLADFGVGDSQTMFQVRGQSLGPRAHHHRPRRSTGSRNLIRVPGMQALMAAFTIPTLSDVARDPGLHFRQIDLKLLVRLPLSQLAAALRTAGQFGYFRLVHFLQARLGPLHEATLSRLPSRPLGMFHPVPPRKWRGLPLPASLQLFHFRLQKLHLLFQSLNRRQRLNQLLFQFGNSLILAIRQIVLLLAPAHADSLQSAASF